MWLVHQLISEERPVPDEDDIKRGHCGRRLHGVSREIHS